MKKFIATLAAALALPLAACGGNTAYEDGAENLTNAGYPMDADTFQTFADSTCENVKTRTGKTVSQATDVSSQTMQLIGMPKDEADLVVAASVKYVCPEVFD